MEERERRRGLVRRLVLRSGRAIEVVRFGEPAPERAGASGVEPDQDLRVCPGCRSELVHPVAWEEAGPIDWTVLLRCPNCGLQREGVFAQEVVERFDRELDLGTEQLRRDLRWLMRANMAEEVERFVACLRADAILPEDF